MFCGNLGLLPNSAAAGTRDGAEVSNRDVTGILISCSGPTVPDKATLSVELRTSDGSEILVPDLPLRACFEIGDLEGGQSLALMQLGSETEGLDATNNTAPASFRPRVGVVLPLGFLRLRDADVLAVNVTATAAVGASEDIKVGWVRTGFKYSEKILKYRIFDSDKSMMVEDVRAMYAYRRSISVATDEASALDGSKLAALVRVGDQEQNSPGDLLYAATLATCECEGQGPRQTIALWRDPESEAGLDNCSVTLTGTAASAWSIIACTYSGSVGRSARKGAEGVQEQLRKIQAFEISNPEKAKVARYQGRAPKSDQLAQVLGVRRQNVPGAVPGGRAY